jgi:type II secretory pathway predicted ATPase ExeA/cell division protein FtsN
LSEAPFGLAPDTRFLFASASHSAALAQVAYAIERREPLVVVTGEIGTGKTLLCRTMLQRLPLKTFLSVIDDPLLERDDLLKQMLEEFGVISKDRARLTEASRHELVETLKAFLASLAKIQAHAVVMIDEAQHLRPDVLEQIRLLSNIDDGRGTLLQVVLVGQKNLEELLARPELRQLQQRVSRRFALEPLNRDEVEQYIGHRLALARNGKPPAQPSRAPQAAPEPGTAEPNPGVEFTPDAIEILSELSAGVPRVINLLCDRSLEEAHASRLRIVDKRLIQAAAAALGIEEHAAPAEPETSSAWDSAATSAAPIAPAAPIALEAPSTPALDILHMPATPAASANTALGLLGTHAGPDVSLDAEDLSEPPTVLDVVQPEAARVIGLPTPPPTASPLIKYVVLAAVLALAAAAVLFFLRPGQPPAAETPSSAAVSPAPRASVARPAPSPASTNPPAPAAATAGRSASPPSTAAAAPQPAAPAPPVAAATAADERFDVIVASFRTDVRATSVAAEVAALGLPIHRRVTEGWQQVIAGPFASRTAAEDAQQRIHRAGLTGTQIVAVVPPVAAAP